MSSISLWPAWRGAAVGVPPARRQVHEAELTASAWNIKNNLPHYLQLHYCHTPHFFPQKGKLVFY